MPPSAIVSPARMRTSPASLKVAWPTRTLTSPLASFDELPVKISTFPLPSEPRPVDSSIVPLSPEFPELLVRRAMPPLEAKAEYPLTNDTEPPASSSESRTSPASTRMPPPSPLSPLPTRMLMLPAASRAADPVERTTSPD
eukprot:scaffold1748_cov258-Pinguiococcus_pyrenoidosus.AAC.22